MGTSKVCSIFGSVVLPGQMKGGIWHKTHTYVVSQSPNSYHNCFCEFEALDLAETFGYIVSKNGSSMLSMQAGNNSSPDIVLSKRSEGFVSAFGDYCINNAFHSRSYSSSSSSSNNKGCVED